MLQNGSNSKQTTHNRPFKTDHVHNRLIHNRPVQNKPLSSLRFIFASILQSDHYGKSMHRTITAQRNSFVSVLNKVENTLLRNFCLAMCAVFSTFYEQNVGLATTCTNQIYKTDEIFVQVDTKQIEICNCNCKGRGIANSDVIF